MKNIILLLGVLSIAGAGLFIYTQGDSAELELLTGDSEVSQTALANAQVYIERSARINALKLNTEVLEDPLFTSLRSYAKPVPTYPIGRPNPFEAATLVPRP